MDRKLEQLKQRIAARESHVLSLEGRDAWLAKLIDKRVAESAMDPPSMRKARDIYLDVAAAQAELHCLPARIALIKTHIEALKKEVSNHGA